MATSISNKIREEDHQECNLSETWKPQKGEIAWLPSQDVYVERLQANCLSSDRQALLNTLKLISQDRKAFDHPVVISSVRHDKLDPKKIHIKFHPISSFQGRSLSEKFPTDHPRSREARERLMLQYVALSPAPPHPVTGKVLSFENGKKMDKGSYVNLLKEYECLSEGLRPFIGCGQESGLVLTEECIEELDDAYHYAATPALPEPKSPTPTQAQPAGIALPSPGLESPIGSPLAASPTGVFIGGCWYYPCGYQYQNGYVNPYAYGYTYHWPYPHPGQLQGVLHVSPVHG